MIDEWDFASPRCVRDHAFGACRSGEREIITIFRDLGYGEVLNIRVAAGEVNLDDVETICDLRPGEHRPSFRYPLTEETRLKKHIVNFLHLVRSHRVEVIDQVLVQDGLPIRGRVVFSQR